MGESSAIGIDLGTTNSVVAMWMPRHNRVEIFENEAGNKTTPSVVAFTAILCIVGDPAKNQIALNPLNTIFESKRLLGRRYTDTTVQDDIKTWPFKVVSGTDGRPMIQVTDGAKEKLFSAEAISSMILAKMKKIAELKLGTSVTEAVITVPAYFNESQRQATKDAAEIAGLIVLRIITEPIAAAITYVLHKKMTLSDGKKNVLVFDLGGGTLDVSLVSMSKDNLAKDNFDVKAVTGDTHLGGADFDNRLVDYFVKEIQTKLRKDISKNPKALGKLRVACEKAKRTLSALTEATIDIDGLVDGTDFSSTITRSRFEHMNLDLFTKCMEQVDKCLKDAQMKKKDVHDFVLVGGSTRIPKIEKLLKELFGGKEPSRCINPDEAVAHGAAYHAAFLSGADRENIADLVIMDATPLTLGFELYSGDMAVVVPKNTTYPTKKTFKTRTAEDNQAVVRYAVYEGEKPRAEDNYLLGIFKLVNIPPGPKGEQEFDVCFDIDSDGILVVSAEHIGGGKREEITITNESRRLPTEEIARIRREAAVYAVKEERRRLAVIAKNVLEDYASDHQGSLKNYDEIVKWIEDNSSNDEARVFEEKLQRVVASLKKK